MTLLRTLGGRQAAVARFTAVTAVQIGLIAFGNTTAGTGIADTRAGFPVPIAGFSL